MRRAVAVAAVIVLAACGHDNGRQARLLNRCLAGTGHAATCSSIVDYAMSAADAKGCHGTQELEAVDRLAQPFVYGRQSAAEFDTIFATCDRPTAPLPAGWAFEPAPPATTPAAPFPSS